MRLIAFLLCLTCALTPSIAHAQSQGATCTAAQATAANSACNVNGCFVCTNNTGVYTWVAQPLFIGTGTNCNTANTGLLQYNGGTIQFCNGSTWTTVAGACSGSAPTAFSFTNQTGVAVSTLTTSNIVQITGISCSVQTSISGTGSPQYEICADNACNTVVQSWTSGTSTIASGQYVQLRLTSSSTGLYQNYASFSAGSVSATWTVTTVGNCTGSPTPGTVCSDGTIYAGISPDTNVPMYTYQCDVGQTWTGSACSGSRLTVAWNNGGSHYVATSQTSSTTGKANTAALVALTSSQNADAPFQAAVDCTNQTYDGHSDWYLPASGELNVLYGAKTAIGNFDTTDGSTPVGGAYPGLYWSSSEGNYCSSYNQRFSDRNQLVSNKNTLFSVRCVRR